ncbi:MAG TPA: tetratricopeptide repeat protein [Chitinophagaceae bacterium]|nr:tetratricopeptide repeat protein [Chitinophagaceae bacterium]
MKTVFSILILLIFVLPGFSQSGNEIINRGNNFFRSNEYDKAAEQYEKALKIDPSDLNAKFNLAAAYYRLDKKEDASKLFTEVATDAGDAELRSKAWYNNGVILSKEKKLEESIEAYKNALRHNPDDKEARENLQKALLELKKPPPPPKKEDNKKKQEQKKQQQKQQSKMSPKEAEQRLKLLEQKEKEVQQRLQKEKTKTAASGNKDW